MEQVFSEENLKNTNSNIQLDLLLIIQNSTQKNSWLKTDYLKTFEELLQEMSPN